MGPESNILGQLFGVELIGVGLLCWFARNISDSVAQKSIIQALLISDVIGLVVSLMGTLSSVMNAVGWSAVVIYLILSLGYTYFQFRRSDSS